MRQRPPGLRRVALWSLAVGMKERPPLLLQRLQRRLEALRWLRPRQAVRLLLQPSIGMVHLLIRRLVRSRPKEATLRCSHLGTLTNSKVYQQGVATTVAVPVVVAVLGITLVGIAVGMGLAVAAVTLGMEVTLEEAPEVQ